MLQEVDIKRLRESADNASDNGERLNLWIKRQMNNLLRKVIVVFHNCTSIPFAFFMGLMFRKED
jgi:hypothetical protein